MAFWTDSSNRHTIDLHILKRISRRLAGENHGTTLKITLRYRMPYLKHSWFDPTSLMSRDVQWHVLPQDALQKKAIIETYRSALLKEQDPTKFAQPKKRGRQRAKLELELEQYHDDLARSIGVVGNDNEVYALYAVKVANVPMGLVGLSIHKSEENITASLDLVYVMPDWRKRGLAHAIAEHAGFWVMNAMCAWREYRTPMICNVESDNEISASLATSFLDAVVRNARLLNVKEPQTKWRIYD